MAETKRNSVNSKVATPKSAATPTTPAPAMGDPLESLGKSIGARLVDWNYASEEDFNREVDALLTGNTSPESSLPPSNRTHKPWKARSSQRVQS